MPVHYAIGRRRASCGQFRRAAAPGHLLRGPRAAVPAPLSSQGQALAKARSATSAVDPDGEATVSSHGSAPFRRYPKLAVRGIRGDGVMGRRPHHAGMPRRNRADPIGSWVRAEMPLSFPAEALAARAADQGLSICINKDHQRCLRPGAAPAALGRTHPIWRTVPIPGDRGARARILRVEPTRCCAVRRRCR